MKFTDMDVIVDEINDTTRPQNAGDVQTANPDQCRECTHCADLCGKLGPSVLTGLDGTGHVVRPVKCISDGACILACPTRATVLFRPPDAHGPAQAA